MIKMKLDAQRSRRLPRRFLFGGAPSLLYQIIAGTQHVSRNMKSKNRKSAKTETIYIIQ
jgi:hypothetical protein